MSKKEQYGQAAERLYLDSGKTIDEIAAMLPVSRKTIGQWCKDGQWAIRKKNQRVSPQRIIETVLKRIEEILTEGELDSKKTDSIAKLEKSLARYMKESEKHFLDRAIEVMDRFLDHLSQKYSDPDKRRAYTDDIEEFFQELEGAA